MFRFNKIRLTSKLIINKRIKNKITRMLKKNYSSIFANTPLLNRLTSYTKNYLLINLN